jgi:hypothetical protein
MMQEKRIEPIVAVEDHGGVFVVTTPFAPAMAEWRQGTRQGKGIFLMNSLYKVDGDIDLTHTCQLKDNSCQITGRINPRTGTYQSLQSSTFNGAARPKEVFWRQAACERA